MALPVPLAQAPLVELAVRVARQLVHDDAEREPSTVHPSPGSPPAPPPEDERDAAVARLKRSIAKAHDLLTWKPEDIHALNDPDCAVRVTELMRQMAPWWETYKTTKPTGLVVHKGGKA